MGIGRNRGAIDDRADDPVRSAGNELSSAHEAVVNNQIVARSVGREYSVKAVRNDVIVVNAIARASEIDTAVAIAVAKVASNGVSILTKDSGEGVLRSDAVLHDGARARANAIDVADQIQSFKGTAIEAKRVHAIVEVAVSNNPIEDGDSIGGDDDGSERVAKASQGKAA